MIVILTRLAVGVALILAAHSDLKSMRIPNAIPIALTFLFIASASLGYQDPLLPHVICFTVAGLIGVALYAGNVWGAGDTKLMAAIAIFMTPVELARFGLVTSLVGGLIATTVLIKRR